MDTFNVIVGIVAVVTGVSSAYFAYVKHCHDVRPRRGDVLSDRKGSRSATNLPVSIENYDPLEMVKRERKERRRSSVSDWFAENGGILLVVVVLDLFCIGVALLVNFGANWGQGAGMMLVPLVCGGACFIGISVANLKERRRLFSEGVAYCTGFVAVNAIIYAVLL